jgi:SET domain-containing protein
MLLIETYVTCTKEKGVGLFANSFIPQGTVYWQRDESFDTLFPPAKMERLKPLSVTYIRKYGFLETSGNWYLCNDNARFSNHCNLPNTQNQFDNTGIVVCGVATKDIQPGEEILCDYREICQTCINGVDFESL